MDYRLYIMQPVSNRLDNIANTISFFISISPLIIIFGNKKDYTFYKLLIR
jgi:hypothetical protein